MCGLELNFNDSNFFFLQGQYADSFRDLLEYESRRDDEETFRDYLKTLIEIEHRCHDTVSL